jgi:hypothetical protein
MKRLVAAGSLVAAAVSVAPAAAVSGSHPLAATKIALSNRHPGKPTALSLTLRLGDPVGSAGKPPQLTKARFVFPKGMRIHTKLLPQCTASDQELQTEGTGACPAKSQVGKGSITADPSAGQHITGDDTVFNGKHELIEVVTAQGASAPAAGIDHLTIKRNVVTAHPPSTPGGPPDFSTNIRRIHFRIRHIAPGGHAYIRTPPRCPASGHWRAVGHFRFADGRSATTHSVVACRP